MKFVRSLAPTVDHPPLLAFLLHLLPTLLLWLSSTDFHRLVVKVFLAYHISSITHVILQRWCNFGSVPARRMPTKSSLMMAIYTNFTTCASTWINAQEGVSKKPSAPNVRQAATVSNGKSLSKISKVSNLVPAATPSVAKAVSQQLSRTKAHHDLNHS